MRCTLAAWNTSSSSGVLNTCSTSPRLPPAKPPGSARKRGAGQECAWPAPVRDGTAHCRAARRLCPALPLCRAALGWRGQDARPVSADGSQLPRPSRRVALWLQRRLWLSLRCGRAACERPPVCCKRAEGRSSARRQARAQQRWQEARHCSPPPGWIGSPPCNVRSLVSCALLSLQAGVHHCLANLPRWSPGYSDDR
jgi:hypothetical protein